MRWTVLAVGVLAAAAPGAWAQPVTPWLHVQVNETSKQSKVNVNLPLTVVEAVLKAAPEKVSADGKIKLGIDDRDVRLDDLRKAWKELKAVGDGQFVTVEEKDQHVEVARKGDLVIVRVENADKGEQVNVEVPVSLVDVVLAGPGDTIDVKAALAELAKRRGDVVRVTDKDSHVRVWIDEGK
jgi:hypothetical protein